MRRTSVKAIAGVAPMLHLQAPTAALPKEQQIVRNTNIALEMMKKFKGPMPAPYERKYTQTYKEVEAEVEALLGKGTPQKRTADDQPMERMAVIERCLRQAVWNYLKDEGNTNFAEMEKWISYTGSDEQKLAAAKRSSEMAEKAAAVAKAAGTATVAPTPEINWAEEYAAVLDREVVAEKRFRYDVMASNTTARDESAIASLKASYLQSAQDKRVDNLIDMLKKFKPIIAREAIMQRLTIKHLEGQLGAWRYLDWNPEVRDRAETEADNGCWWWWYEMEEKRMASVRLRTKTEVTGIMEKNQAARNANKVQRKTSAVGGGKKNEARARLLAEVIMLQTRKTDTAEASA